MNNKENLLEMKSWSVIYISNNGIKWKFTTALALWQGGFYERIVGLVKQSLRKATGLKRLTLDQSVVILAEVEVVINTRPLTNVYENFQSVLLQCIS